MGGAGPMPMATPDTDLGRITPSTSGFVRALSVLTAGALVVDGAVHLALAGDYAMPNGGILAEDNLFRAQAVLALMAAAWLLTRPRQLVFGIAGAVAALAAVAVITTTYVDLGALGPIPDLYQPTWSVVGKVPSMVAEVAAVPLALAGAVLSRHPHRA